MVKRHTNGRKPSGRSSNSTGAIAVIEDPIEQDDAADEIDAAPVAVAEAPKRERKTKTETPAEGNFSVADVRKWPRSPTRSADWIKRSRCCRF